MSKVGCHTAFSFSFTPGDFLVEQGPLESWEKLPSSNAEEKSTWEAAKSGLGNIGRRE